jgi:SAM-dependent methyltransferase
MNQVNPISVAETTRSRFDADEADIDAALAYERIFVPALFEPWPRHVIAAADIGAAHRTLDVACGTGVLTRAMAKVTDPVTPPVGLDINPGMLAVAERLEPDCAWQHGDAQSLPFAAESFDRVVCQYGLMFFPDRVGALKEMSRVLAPGGRMALAVWDALEHNPGFSEKVAVLDRVAGTRAGDALRAPFCLGDTAQLEQMAYEAGLNNVQIETITGDARFDSLHDFVEAEVRGWLPVMDVHLDEDVIRSVHAACREALGSYIDTATGEILLPTSAHILSADNPA